MIDSRILVGLLAVLISIGGMVYIGINEPDRQAEFERAFHGRSIEAGAALYTEYCAECHGLHGEGNPRAPALNSRQFFENRVKEVGYQGGLPNYIRLTIEAGRPIRTEKWPQDMPTWGIEFGGPLRVDQVDYLVDYIMNWEKGAPDEGAAPVQVTGDTPEERGASIFQVQGCVACHAIDGVGGAVGPDLTNIFSQGEDYLRESILMPNDVIAEGFQANIMPENFGDRLSDQDLDDLISYFKSLVEN